MARVLIAGGCGFLGSHLCDRVLRRKDVEACVVVDNLWTGLQNNVAHITDPRFQVVAADIELFSPGQLFDEIYHLASPASPPWYMKEPRRTISANLLGAMKLLDLLADGGRFGFTSTSEVYGDPQITPQPERYRGSVDCTGPRSSYDESKRCTESLLFETLRTKGLDLRVVRLFNVYGPRTRADDGRAVPTSSLRRWQVNLSPSLAMACRPEAGDMWMTSSTAWNGTSGWIRSLILDRSTLGITGRSL